MKKLMGTFLALLNWALVLLGIAGIAVGIRCEVRRRQEIAANTPTKLERWAAIQQLASQTGHRVLDLGLKDTSDVPETYVIRKGHWIPLGTTGSIADALMNGDTVRYPAGTNVPIVGVLVRHDHCLTIRQTSAAIEPWAKRRQAAYGRGLYIARQDKNLAQSSFYVRSSEWGGEKCMRIDGGPTEIASCVERVSGTEEYGTPRVAPGVQCTIHDCSLYGPFHSIVGINVQPGVTVIANNVVGTTGAIWLNAAGSGYIANDRD